MSKKDQEKLRRLNAALLAKDGETQESSEQPAISCKAYNTDRTDIPPESYEKALARPKKRISPFLIFLLLALLAGAAWLVYQQGVRLW